MGKVNAKDIPIERQMFSDVWEIYKNYHDVEISDSYIENLTRDIKATFRKYKDYDFAIFAEKMLLGMLDGFDLKIRELIKKQGNESHENL